MKMPPVLLNPACPDYPVVHLEHLIIPDPTDQSGIRPDNPILRHDTYIQTGPDSPVKLVYVSCVIEADCM